MAAKREHFTQSVRPDTLPDERSDVISSTMSEVDAKIAAAEARTDSKFAQVMGEFRLLNQRFDHFEQRLGKVEQRLDHHELVFSSLRLNIWLASATTVGLVIAILSWGTSMFGVGLDAQTIAEQAGKNAVLQVQPKIDAMGGRLDAMEGRLDAMEGRLDKVESRLDNLENQLGEVLTIVRSLQNTQQAPAPQ
jgi:DNA anti-recombination protein RmuC